MRAKAEYLNRVHRVSVRHKIISIYKRVKLLVIIDTYSAIDSKEGIYFQSTGDIYLLLHIWFYLGMTPLLTTLSVTGKHKYLVF